jgi:hypothetical protein
MDGIDELHVHARRLLFENDFLRRSPTIPDFDSSCPPGARIGCCVIGKKQRFCHWTPPRLRYG